MDKHIEVLKRMQQTLLITRLHGEDEYDYIKRDKALEAAITALEWVSVEDRQPKYSDWYYAVVKKGNKSKVKLVFCYEKTHKTSSIYKSKGTGIMCWDIASMNETVTHWKPLPPKEQDDEDKN